ncbi:sugar ABC transporter substrate-binding protein [Bacillaceae bacterium SIJ1]|uniref:ABC transporter substrate-binding protein n=1 Tax=Litoribacterium kuwaitense TaxID=1398745 RepID=UPI0013EDFE95|nr:sugar ABC transporter substrate-binding protein [Litoribacterium kuwaitense]NGP46368.1 sugar ABC transporter substrate-binding protein [Litoribacterium kuwaitense]
MKSLVFKKRVMVVMLFVLILSACSSGGKPEGSAKTATGENDKLNEREITFMTISLSPAFDEYLQQMIDEYEAANEGVTIEWRDVPMDQVEQMVMTRASSGDLPDVMNLNTLYLKKLAGLGALVNMDEAAADAKEDYFTGLWQSGSVGDANYAIPWYVTTGGFLYNEDILNEAGFEEPPSTFEEAWEYSEVIYEKTGAYGEVIEPKINKMMSLHGISILNEDTTAAELNTPEAVELWTKLKDKYDQGLVPKNILLGQMPIPEMYAQEKVAFWSTGPQLFRQVKDLSPDVYEQSDAAPALVSDANLQYAAIMNLAVPKQSEHVDLAVDFALFVTNAQNQLAFSKEANTLPSVREAAQDEYFTKGEDSDDPAERGNFFAAQQLEIAQDITIPHEKAGEINDALTESFQEMLINDGEPEQTLADLEAEINGILQD